MGGRDIRVLQDYALPQVSGITSSIVSLALKENNFKLSPVLVTFVERDQFSRHPSNNPNVHLQKFLAKYDTIKLNAVSIMRFD